METGISTPQRSRTKSAAAAVVIGGHKNAGDDAVVFRPVQIYPLHGADIQIKEDGITILALEQKRQDLRSAAAVARFRIVATMPMHDPADSMRVVGVA